MDGENCNGWRKFDACSNNLFFIYATYITQIIHSDAYLNPLNGILRDKPIIIAEIPTF